NWFHEAHLESSTSNAQDACNADALESSGNFNPTATSTIPPADHMETLTVKYAIPTVSSHVLTACLNDSTEPSSDTRLILKRVTSQDDIPSLDNILTLSNRFEDILRVTKNTGDTNGVEANLGNMEYNISASPTPTFRIHKEEPKKVSDALNDPSWVEAMQEELLQFKMQNVWILVDCLKRVRPIGNKWVLKNKKDERGIVIKNKAMLVAQGHTQKEGIEYEEVFAPVARIKAIRLFLAYASFMRFTIYQMDVKSAYLYGTIHEEVYLCREFEALMHKKFQMSAMGELNFFLGLQVLHKKDDIFLSQDKYVGDIFKKFGYSDVRSANTPMDKENPWGKDETGKDVDLHLYRSMIGSLMYLTASRPDIMFAVCACARHQVTPKECHLHVVKRIFRYLKDEEVYVMQPPGFQDLSFLAKVYKVEKAIEFKALMHEKFQMSAMGELNFFLGHQVLQKEDGIFLSQDKYIGDILNKCGYSDVRSSNTPMDKENPWGKDGTGKDVDLHLYRSMIGSLMYLTASRPDIMFTVCACARHQVTPKECHLSAVKRIFRYLKGHPKLGLWYPKASPFDLVTFLDSDYGGAS
nr:hypothetical protein [Tanacetum cinerariifolium]GEY21251.1 hypothetical protein [Tanacetum cinerariifolium]